MQGLFTLTRIAMQGYHSSVFFFHGSTTTALSPCTLKAQVVYMPGFYKGHILRQGEHASMHVLPEGDV